MWRYPEKTRNVRNGCKSWLTEAGEDSGTPDHPGSGWDLHPEGTAGSEAQETWWVRWRWSADADGGCGGCAGSPRSFAAGLEVGTSSFSVSDPGSLGWNRAELRDRPGFDPRPIRSCGRPRSLRTGIERTSKWFETSKIKSDFNQLGWNFISRCFLLKNKILASYLNKWLMNH